MNVKAIGGSLVLLALGAVGGVAILGDAAADPPVIPPGICNRIEAAGGDCEVVLAGAVAREAQRLDRADWKEEVAVLKYIKANEPGAWAQVRAQILLYHDDVFPPAEPE